jgi:hypothetical protein
MALAWKYLRLAVLQPPREGDALAAGGTAEDHLNMYAKIVEKGS